MKTILISLMISFAGSVCAQNLAQETVNYMISNKPLFKYNKKNQINSFPEDLVDKYTLLSFSNDSVISSNFTIDKTLIKKDSSLVGKCLNVPKKLKCSAPCKGAWNISIPIMVGNVRCVVANIESSKGSGGRRDIFIYDFNGKFLKHLTSLYVH